MEKVFANLYRVGAPNRRGTSHTYLLVRKEGNLLVCHQTRPSTGDIKEIKALGGIESQWICHNHDTVGDGFHEDMHDQFDCKLYHHKEERKAVRRKTKCPEVQYGDEGLKVDSDFEALYFPACTKGHSVFRWRYRGKYYLFTSHAMYLHENKWDIQCRPRPEAVKLDELQVDYVFPGYSSPEEDGFYRLNDSTKKSLSKALASARQNN
jgi:hypothetical protein